MNPLPFNWVNAEIWEGENHSQNPGLYKSRAQDGVEAVIKT